MSAARTSIDAVASKLIPPALAITLIVSSHTQPCAKYVLVAVPLDVATGELSVAVGIVLLVQ